MRNGFVFISLATLALYPGIANGEESVEFNRQIRPLLSQHCIACHGPDEGDRQADLRLDTFEGATESAITPGNAESSELIDRLTSEDKDMRMPPAEHAEALKPQEIELLRRWINEGAKYQTHWSFAPIMSPPVPNVTSVPQSRAQPVIHNSIDNFILERVYAAGLNPNEPTTPRALVRRVSLDLTGLPPIAHGDEVQSVIESYLASSSQEDYSRLVDELCDTAAYAEHWATVWLDIARYADTCGYAGDERRDIWPWRDWLIQAIQSKKSYKDMSIEMLAGDMLPNATTNQRLATAFHRNTLSNNEGGTDDEEFRTIAVKDRLSTTLNAWMGLTVRCAECHSHKYDPISHKEYYQLLDFLNQTVDADNRDDRPKLEIKVAREPKETAELDKKIAELQERLKSKPQVWHTLRPVDMRSREGTTFELLDNDSILATGPLPGTEEYSFTFEAKAGTSIQAVRLEALPHLEHDGNVGRAPEGAFILSQIRLATLAKSPDDENPKEVNLLFADAANDYNQVHMHAKTAILPEIESGGKQGWAVNHPVTGYRAPHEAIFELKKAFIAEEDTSFVVHLVHDPPWKRLNLGCVRISVCDVDDAVKKYNEKQLDQLNREIAQLKLERQKPIRVPVLEERDADQQRETFVNLRGNFRSKGEKVSAEFPEAFLPGNDSLPRNRLGLARWLFDENNPLTARVAVNRYWARLMGIGIVETEEDFGTQGTPPTHPELLDHLASEFRTNWDVREIQKKIVLSATYQQSQTGTNEALEKDPRNRMLARGPRIRLAAEVVRDQALAVSGLLSKKLYGRPVYPPSPLKNVVNAFTGGMKWQESRDEDRYRRALYTFLKRSAPHPLFETFDMSSRDICSLRRQRTNTPLQSFMTLNDITFIEAARALADKMLPVREMNNDANNDSNNKSNGDSSSLSGSKVASSIRHGIETALYAPATDPQIEVLVKLYQSSLEEYHQNPDAAAQLAGQQSTKNAAANKEETNRLAEHAAMTVVANAILNLDSFLNN